MARLAFICGVWMIGPENLDDRLGCDFALVLAAVAMKFVVVQMLPPSSVAFQGRALDTEVLSTSVCGWGLVLAE